MACRDAVLHCEVGWFVSKARVSVKPHGRDSDTAGIGHLFIFLQLTLHSSAIM